MTFHNRLRTAFAVYLLITSLATHAFAAERTHNMILVVPEILASVTVDMGTAPVLTRFRSEGVYFNNSYKGFPKLATRRNDTSAASDLDIASMVAAARDQYTTASVEFSGDIDADLFSLLTEYKDKTPFFIVYHIGMAALTSELQQEEIGPPSPDEPVPFISLLATDEALAYMQSKLKEFGLYDTTNVVVAGEHGFSRVWKDSKTSIAIDVIPRFAKERKLQPGFFSIDLVYGLQRFDSGLSLFDSDERNRYVEWESGDHPVKGNAIIAVDPSDPTLTIRARGDHELIYLPKHLPGKDARELTQWVIHLLGEQDYVGGIFIDEKRLGRMRGTLPLSQIGWDSKSDPAVPDIVVTFISMTMDCEQPLECALVIADTPLEEGAVFLGSFSRADTWNFMAARGPDFRTRKVSNVPASNADMMRTIAELLQLRLRADQKRSGRVLTESLRAGNGAHAPRVRKEVVASKLDRMNDAITELRLERVGSNRYFVAAGAPGWAVGIPRRPEPIEWRPWRWDWPTPKIFTIDITPD